MAITSKIAPLYGGQKIFAALLCLVFGVWGIYDYAVAIPRKQVKFDHYQQLKTHLDQLDEQQSKLPPGMMLSPAAADDYKATRKELDALAPGGAVPNPPSKWYRFTQWFFILSLPFFPICLWMYIKAKRQVYRLDDDGTLHFAGDPVHKSGQWKQQEIADIDMSRWMAKSIAYVVHSDGTRLKLDAYLHKNLDLIIGAIASRLHPQDWTAEAKPVKPEVAAIEAMAEPE
jgi:hypothetical protein